MRTFRNEYSSGSALSFRFVPVEAFLDDRVLVVDRLFAPIPSSPSA